MILPKLGYVEFCDRTAKKFTFRPHKTCLASEWCSRVPALSDSLYLTPTPHLAQCLTIFITKDYVCERQGSKDERKWWHNIFELY